MTLLPPEAIQRLSQHHQGRLVVAFSGGMDSTALLHALVRAGLNSRIEAVHVNHGLQAQAFSWQAHCAAVCSLLEVPLQIAEVEVSSRGSLEAAARRARYQAFEKILCPADLLLMAHHREDHIETAMLTLLRGYAGMGLSGMPASRGLGEAEIYRPLLTVSQSTIVEYALQHKLDFIEDPSNQDTRHDRNYLRHNVMPRLEGRFPDWASRLESRLDLDQQARALLTAYGVQDVKTLRAPQGFSVVKLKALERFRGLHVLNTLIAQCAAIIPSRRQLTAAYEMLVADGQVEPRVMLIAGFELHRHGQWFDLLPPVAGNTASDEVEIKAGTEIELGGFELKAWVAPGGIKVPAGAKWLRGGRGQLKLEGSHKRLSELLREQGIPFWVRQRLPVLTERNRLLAIPELPDWAVTAQFNEAVGLDQASQGLHVALIRSAV